MTSLAIVLVLLSALAHVSWNLLAKRASTPEVFTWWMAAASSVLTLPLAAFLLITDPPDPVGWVFAGGTIGLHIFYFVTLARAYRYGDLSIVYPVARGLGLLLIPMLGVIILNESMSWPAMLGAGLIFAGIVTVGISGVSSKHLSVGLRGLLSDSGFRYAVATGVAIAAYSVLDKQGVNHVTPVLYMFFLSAGGATGMLVVISREHPRATFRAEFRQHAKAIVIGGALQFAAYTLVLSALRLSPVSYVGPFREVGIVFGVLLGALVLKEHVSRGRLAGAGAVAAGAVAIALAP